MRSQENRAACRRAPADSSSRRASTVADARRRSRRGSWPSTRTPETPSRTAVRRPPTAAATTGRAAGLRLQGDQAEGLVVAGDDGHVGGAVVLGQPGRRLRRQEADDVGDAELARRAPAAAAGRRGRSRWARRRRAPAAGRAARGRRRASRAAACSSTSGALSGWMRPDEQQHQRVVRARRPRAARPRRSPGRNRSRSTPGRDDERARGVGAVVLDELAGLLVGVGDQPVGLGDHLLLADHPGARLGPVALGQRRVLDLGERVRGVDQRHAPPVAGQPADLAGQPVVRVDDVVEARLVLGLLAQHRRR